jgi:hypothetical protein
MTLARASSEVSEVSEPRDEEAGQSFRLLENSLALARRQLAVQTSLLGDAQQRAAARATAPAALERAVS